MGRGPGTPLQTVQGKPKRRLPTCWYTTALFIKHLTDGDATSGQKVQFWFSNTQGQCGALEALRSPSEAVGCSRVPPLIPLELGPVWLDVSTHGPTEEAERGIWGTNVHRTGEWGGSPQGGEGGGGDWLEGVRWDSPLFSPPPPLTTRHVRHPRRQTLYRPDPLHPDRHHRQQGYRLPSRHFPRTW